MSSLSYKKGFTLLEMMVVIFIITVMTGVLLGNLPNFRDSTTLQLVTQEVAVTIRGAQVFGIGTRVVTGGGFPGHGIYFCGINNSQSTASCRKNFVLFTDPKTTNNGTQKWFDGYNSFSIGSNQLALADTAAWRTACLNDYSHECREVYALGGNIEICAITKNDNYNNGGTLDTDNPASITFSRLYPDAFMTSSKSDADNGNFDESTEIYLRSTRNTTKGRKIIVYNTGGITVQNVDTTEIQAVCGN